MEDETSQKQVVGKFLQFPSGYLHHVRGYVDIPFDQYSVI